MKNLKHNSYPGDNVKDFCAAIQVDADFLESSGVFETEDLWYITCAFEDNSDSIICLWEIQKYNQVTEFIKKLCLCDIDVISQEDIVTYEYLAQEATREYHDLVYSKRWEPATSKDKSQD